MGDGQQELVDWYLAAFPAVRQELGLPFGGFGPQGAEALAQRLAAAERWADAARAGDAMRLARRALHEAQDTNSAALAESVLTALLQSELQGTGREEVLAAIPQALAGPAAAGQDPRELDQAARAAALAAGLLIAIGAKPEESASGEPKAMAFMALEHHVRALDLRRDAAAVRAPMGAHALHDLWRDELGSYLVPKELAEAALVRMDAERHEAVRLAREIAPGTDMPDLLAELGEDCPDGPQELMAAYDETQAELIEAVGGDFPEVAAPRLEPGPSHLHGLLPLAAYVPPGLAGGRGRLLVFAGQGPMRAMHMRSRLALTVAQAGVPGSHLLFSSLPKGATALRILVSPHIATGWSSYAQAYVAERLQRPKVRLVQALDAAQRAARAFADLALHAGLAPEERILEVLGRPQGLPEELQRAELQAIWRRPLSGAGPWWLEQAIRDDVREMRRSGLGPAQAHGRILLRGGMPQGVAR